MSVRQLFYLWEYYGTLLVALAESSSMRIRKQQYKQVEWFFGPHKIVFFRIFIFGIFGLFWGSKNPKAKKKFLTKNGSKTENFGSQKFFDPTIKLCNFARITHFGVVLPFHFTILVWKLPPKSTKILTQNGHFQRTRVRWKLNFKNFPFCWTQCESLL